jgi:chromosome segregation ATPase
MLQKMRNRAVLLIVLLISGSAMAQKPSPCSAAELRASIAESRVAAEKLRAEACAARTEAGERELARQKGQVGEVEAKLASESTRAAMLVLSNASQAQRIAELESKLAKQQKVIIAKDETITMVTSERDKARREAKRARGRTVGAAIAAAVLAILGALK